MSNGLIETGGITGEVTLRCISPKGKLRWESTTKNLITTAGDVYYAQRAVEGVNSNGETGPSSLAAGMALGTNGTAAAKSSTGASIGTYISGSRQNFDAGSPDIASAAVSYVVTWAAGDATDSAIAEIAITTDTDDTGGTEGSTIARAVISPTRNKGAEDTLEATWTHTFLGAA